VESDKGYGFFVVFSEIQGSRGAPPSSKTS
jgi:hypothetical protein